MRYVVFALVLFVAVPASAEPPVPTARLCDWQKRRMEWALSHPELTAEQLRMIRERYESCQQSIAPLIAREEAQAAYQRKMREQEEAAAAQRQAAEQQANEVAARINDASVQFLQDKTFLTVATSAQMCRASADRAAALAEIAKLHKYAKIGGAINLTALLKQQQQIRQADEALAAQKRALAQGKLHQLPCANAAVAELIACLDDSTAPQCQTEDAKARLMAFGNDDDQ